MQEPHEADVARAIASITGQPLPENPDTPVITKIMQGALAGYLMSAARGVEHFPVKIHDVEIPVDRDGNYETHFIVITESGIRIKVTVEPEL